MDVRIIAIAGAAIVAVLGLGAAVLSAIIVGSRADERDLRAQGCTCEHPRSGEHEGRCPMAAP